MTVEGRVLGQSDDCTGYSALGSLMSSNNSFYLAITIYLYQHKENNNSY
jgi:hypothetical protein